MLFYRYESIRPITLRYSPSAGYTRVCDLYRGIYNFLRESNLRPDNVSFFSSIEYPLIGLTLPAILNYSFGIDLLLFG